MTIAGVLLAAGEGSRFNGSTHKLQAVLDGEPIFVHAARAMIGAGFNQIVVVTGAADLTAEIALLESETGRSITVAHNPAWATGQASSLRAGLAVLGATGCTAAVVGLGDQPRVGIAAWRTVGASRGTIVSAVFEGKRRPPVKLDRSVWELLPSDGDEGARVVMQQHPDLVSEVPCQGAPFDIDTAEDLLAAEQS